MALRINDECLESWQKIGQGGFGYIYRAKHTELGLDVAIKSLHCDGSDSTLLKEAGLMRHGENPNVLRILGVYEGKPGSSQLGLVMEYMERGSLVDLQRALGGPPPWPLAFRIMYQIALGMNYLHHLIPPLLHLDLKPSNVLLDDSLNAKLTDFGLSKLAQSYSKMSHKQDEEMGGTTSYMPPEAFQSSTYTPTTSFDVYSYGILLWSVITGKEPYHSALHSLIPYRVIEGDRPDLGSVDVNQACGLRNLVDLMKSCWVKEPEQRPTFKACVKVTEIGYNLHKQEVHAAVSDTVKKLDSSRDKTSSLVIRPNIPNENLVEMDGAKLIQKVDPIADELKPTIGPIGENFVEMDGAKLIQKVDPIADELKPTIGPIGVLPSSMPERFLENYESKLIQKVSLVDPIADDLKSVIGLEKYAKVRAAGTSQNKMRVLISFLQGPTLKERFYQSLMKKEQSVLEDLFRNPCADK